MATLSSDDPVPLMGPPPPVRLRSWPLRDEKLPVLSILTAAAIASGLAGWFAGSVYLGAAALLALNLALWRFWIPIEYELGRKGILQTIFTWQRRSPWRQFQRYQVCNQGVLLLGDNDRSVLGQLKGLYIPWQNRQREVMAVIEHYLGTSRGPVSSASTRTHSPQHSSPHAPREE